MASLLLSIAIAAVARWRWPPANTIRWRTNRAFGKRRQTWDVIVKLRKDGAGAAIAKLSNGTDRTAALAKRTGLALGLKREISESMLASTRRAR